MKTLIAVALAAVTFASCGDNKSTETTTDTSFSTDTVNTFQDTSTMMSDNTTNTNAYMPMEGDVSYQNGKVMVYRNNAYVESDRDITLDSGIVVKRSGEVSRNGKVVRMEDGETVSKTGRFFDRAGVAIENGWDATKRGVSKAANAVGKGAKKVGEEVKDAVH